MFSEIQPWRVTVYDNAFTRQGWVNNPVSLSVIPRCNAVGVATVTVPFDHPTVGALMAPGARVVVEQDNNWDSEGASDWVQVLSGPVVSFTGNGPSTDAVLTVQVADDFRALGRLLCWPYPGGALSAQPDYRRVSGPAETVAKTLISENAARLGLPLTVAPDLGRGTNISVAARFRPATDVLVDAVEQAGLQITVTQSGPGLVVDVRETVVYPRALSEQSGAIRSWTLTGSGPDATRVVVGGPGELTDREFVQVTDSGLETEWGVHEVFLDAVDADTTALMLARGERKLVELAPTSGFSVTFADTPTLRVGRDLNVGDTVTLDVAGVRVTDILREALITWTAGNGPAVEPRTAGWRADPQTVLVQKIQKVVRAVSALGTR